LVINLKTAKALGIEVRAPDAYRPRRGESPVHHAAQRRGSRLAGRGGGRASVCGGVKGVVATSANRVDDRVSVSTTSQFKPPGPLSHLSIFVPLYELLNSLRCLKAILLNW
jgi:hypothetical protein